MLHSTLFTPHSVEDYFQQLWESMNNVIDDIPAEEIELAEPERLAAEVAQTFCVTCPVLGKEINYDQPPFSPGSRTVTVPLYVPFTGNHEMFRCHGRSHPVMTQQFQVEEQQLATSFFQLYGQTAGVDLDWCASYWKYRARLVAKRRRKARIRALFGR